MKKICIWLLGIFPFLWGCFEDEGNYNYKKLNTITEDGGMEWKYTIHEGDGLKIEPKLHFKYDSVNVNLKYEWLIGDTIIESEILDVPVYPGPLGYKICNLKVTDLDIDLPYFFPFAVEVYAKYQTCWLLLSEKDGKSNLSLVREKHEEGADGKITTTYFEEFDVYKNVNGRELGSEPVKLIEHFTGKTMGSELAEVWVLQNGEKGTVLLNGASLKHESYLAEEFIGDQLPANFRIKDAMFFCNTHWVLSEDGKMYSRLSDDQALFHAGRFDPEPVGGKRYHVSLLLPSCFYTLYGGLFFEKNSKQYMFIYDGPWYPEESGEIRLINWNKYGDNFTPLNEMGDREPIFSAIRDCGYYAPAYYYCILFDESEQKFYRQYFEFEANYGFGVYPVYEETVFPGNVLTKESEVAIGRMTPYLFFTGGANQEKLYWLSTESSDPNELPREFEFDFKGERITSITITSDEDLGDRLGVATEQGKFYIFKFDNVILTSGKTQEPLYQMQGNPGSIKDVIYKVADAQSFWDGKEGR
ncbi:MULTISPECIES: PKD-like family lipoprotein [Butyricimonas]|uniref:PKD-like family lipoprotein n=1 Tax=Butyricimonas TaxID=574697 RepID=UPI0016525EBE|nr:MULTISPECIES: PKD-like family lipoprotein [Butyricimonas]